MKKIVMALIALALIWPQVSKAKFGTGGIVTTDIGNTHNEAWGLILQPDGKLVAAGWKHNGSNSDFAVARFDINGNMDFGVYYGLTELICF